MKSAALTVKVFGVYVALVGLALLFAPNVLLPILGLPKSTEIWVHVVGALALVISYYYWVLAAANVRAFFVASVQGRMIFCAACLALVAGADGPPVLLVFGLVDVAGAGWTLAALRSESSAG